MIDLRDDLAGLLTTLSQTPAATGGRTVMFMSAQAGEGVSSVAASFALLAAETARKPVWLIDLDLRRNQAFNAFAVGEFSAKFGGVGPPYSAALKTRPFYTLEPEEDPSGSGVGALTAHRVGETRLMVTQFDASVLKPGQALRIRTQPGYWEAVRAATDWAVIDAPALERAGAGLAIAAMMDSAVIVVKADATPPADVDNLRKRIMAHGGRVAGALLNRRRADAQLTDRLSE
ncbi:MAG: sugar kinase [Alphaproteobacteria bacterium]|nr:sugar kinase [Alphaproteobacteria bacterium]